MIRFALRRKRLDVIFENAADRRCIWVCAPPGYGKTTAVADHLRTFELPTVWYQCDGGDSDPAAFFHYLSIAFTTTIHRAPVSVPKLAPDNLPAVTIFARQFFRRWISLLPASTRLVLDNWQDVPAGSALKEILPGIVDEIPASFQLIVISREVPAPVLSRAVSLEHLTVVDASALRFTLEETAAIAKLVSSESGHARPSTRELHDVTEGWPAAVLLMLRIRSGIDAPSVKARFTTPQIMFDLLSTEVFDRLEPSIRDFLLKTACLEYVAPEVATHVSGCANAAAILKGLVRQNALTTYRPGSDTFHYHPLFREFLLARLNSEMTAADRFDLLLRAASGLAVAGDAEAACGLMLQAKAWHAAIPLIIEVAPQLAHHTRYTTLLGWIKAIPSQITSSNQWLLYWRGACEFILEFPHAHRTLAEAYDLFRQSDEELGQMLCAALILEHINFSYIDFSPMAAWVDKLSSMLAGKPHFPSPAIELQVVTRLLHAFAMSAPMHKHYKQFEQRVFELLRADVDLLSRTAGLAALATHFAMSGRISDYKELEPSINDVLTKRDLGPASRIHLLWLSAWERFVVGEGMTARALMDTAQADAREYNLVIFFSRLELAQLQIKQFHEQRAEIAQAFTRLEPSIPRMTPISRSQARYLQGAWALACGEPERALKLAMEGLEVFRRSGWVVSISWYCLLLSEIHCALEDFESANLMLEESGRWIHGLDAPVVSFNRALMEAELARCQNREEDCLRHLESACVVGRGQGIANGITGYSMLLSRLIPIALQAGIEVDYCRDVVRKRRFEPPLAHIARWPHQVKVYALGPLNIEVEDSALDLTGRTSRRPLSLLGLLIARNGIEMTRLMDLLWPQGEGDSARNALDLVIHRLRKLLGCKEAVLLTQGRVTINPRLVWVDAFILDKLAATHTVSKDLPRSVDQLLGLYRGRLLEGDDNAAITAARDRLTSSFVRVAVELAQQCAAIKNWNLLESLAQQASDREPSSEELHRWLLKALVNQGHVAEAEAAFQRCARLLERDPTPSTRGLLEHRQQFDN